MRGEWGRKFSLIEVLFGELGVVGDYASDTVHLECEIVLASGR